MKRSEKGFTLVEILVVLAIVALIGGAASMATSQVITGTKRSNDHMTAIRQVQNAGYWISRDTLMAQSIVAGDDPDTAEVTEFLILSWTEWEKDRGKKGDKEDKDSIYHLVTYSFSFEDMADGLKKLERNHWSSAGADEDILVAKYIDDSDSFFEQEDGRWILYIEATLGTVTETREYEVTPRVNMQRLMQ